MAQVVDSGGASRPVKNEQKAKNDEIKKATDDLNAEKIGVLEFLARVTCKTKKLIVDMAHFDVPRGYISDLSEDEEDGSDNDENHSSTLHLNSNDEDDGICIICADERKCVVFMPCRDMKCCKTCSSEIAARSGDKFPCPFCKQTVEDTIVVFV